MALVKDHMRRMQASSYIEEFPAPYGIEEFHRMAMEDKTLNCLDWMLPDGASINAMLSKHSNPSSYSHHVEYHQKSSKLSNNGGFEGILQPCGGSFLNFAHKANEAAWNPNICGDGYKWEDDLSKNSSSEMAANWVFTDSMGVLHSIAEEELYHDTGAQKRPHKRDSTQTIKKQRGELNASKKAKTVVDSCSKDPQSMAAKQRRERISERLKILQELVPNGSKVDLVTMLEKAISYVKFLQLQVKVLATDEFWPAQGGKAPDISQVKEAIDAILLSQRSINGCSSSKLPVRQQ